MNANGDDADNAAAPSQGPRRVEAQHAWRGAVPTDARRSDASAALLKTIPESMAAVLSPPALVPLPATAASASSPEMGTIAAFFPQSTAPPSGVSDREADDSGESSAIASAATPQRRRTGTQECALNAGHRGGSSDPSHRAPRALSAGRTPQQLLPNSESGRDLSFMPTSGDAIPAFRACPGTASCCAGPVTGPLEILSASTALTKLGSASTPPLTSRSLLSALHIVNASTMPDTPLSDTRAHHDTAVEGTPPIAPAVHVNGRPATPQHNQERHQRPFHTADPQPTAPDAGAAGAAMPDTPGQWRLSQMQYPGLHLEQRPSRFLTSTHNVDAAVPRMTDHMLVNAEFSAMQLLPERRVELPSRDTEAGGGVGRTGPEAHLQQRAIRNSESEAGIGWHDAAHLTPLFRAIPPVTSTSLTGAAFLQQVRIATSEERRVRLLFHTRPRIRLRDRPRIVTNPVLDRPGWVQPLCYPTLWIPCMRNTIYSIPLSTVMRAPWETDFFGSAQPSVAFSASETSVLPGEQPRPDFSGAAHGGSRALGAPLTTAMPTAPAFYHVPITAPRLAQSSAHNHRADSELLLHRMPAPPSLNPLSGIGERAAANSHGELLISSIETASRPVRFAHNCSHLLYRCFCVRCAIASQMQALQADAEIRGAKMTLFPSCTCLGVESESHTEILSTLCLLDLFTLGAPFGCCCYHGLGSALYGWHLRYMLRARYRIFAWTSIDLLIMCCIPGLALDQQGAELLLNGTPEATVGLQFMA
ncbi:hypothetical protein conserved [Leishmania donovani]|uniref:Putative integral membrane protein n=2 Tax=Leishmania donovani TaxID=5661 RepID=A0A504Y095_LEIDO|nr:putative integral membrane protein [Leishmania donovani]CAJ1987899.1 hypothetical protein conserved [Leishmania donovani]